MPIVFILLSETTLVKEQRAECENMVEVFQDFWQGVYDYCIFAQMKLGGISQSEVGSSKQLSFTFVRKLLSYHFPII